jgi:hypothetical protein
MLTIKADTGVLRDLAKRLEAFGKKLPNAQALVLNRVGTRVRQKVVPTLTAQTGLNRRVITKAVKMHRASPANPRVAIWTRGGDISLKYFGAREVPGGVVANVKGDREFIRGGFRRSGPPGRRVLSAKLNGHVFENTSGGKWRGHIRKVKSGVFIPAEMVRGETAKAFHDIVANELPAQVEKELAKLLPGR